MRYLLIYCSLLLASPVSLLTVDPDGSKSLAALVASHGLRLLEYRVVSDDGYVVTLHRVVSPDYDPLLYSLFRKPVIIFHGVLTDTAIYFMSEPASKAAHPQNGSCSDNFGVCLLATGRYDLWMPNARGSRYSREHLRYTDKDARFWAYSWEHIALHDLSAIIDFVVHSTGHKTVAYIGYSQGASTLFALMSMRPSYSHIVQPFICWAPGVYLSQAKTVVRAVLKASRGLVTRVPGEYVPSASFINPMLQFAACQHSIGRALCSLALQLIFGPTEHLNVTRIPTYFHFVPSAISNWQVAHYTQIGAKGEFTRFDYGQPAKNYQAYGLPYAPLWPLWRISPRQKQVVMYGRTDWFVDRSDARKLIRRLRSYGLDTDGYEVPSPTWNHIDFFMGRGAGRLLYPEVIRYLDLYAWH